MSKIKLDYDKIIINPNDGRVKIGEQYYCSTGVASLANAIKSDSVVTLVAIDTTEINGFKVRNKYNSVKNVSILYPAEESVFKPTSLDVYYCMVIPSPKSLKPYYVAEKAIEEAKRLKVLCGSSDKVQLLKVVGEIERGNE